MRGRVEKSSKRKWLTGSKRGVKNNPDPQGLTEYKCPNHIIGYGEQLWQSLAPKLIELNLLTELDQASFETLCTSYHLMREAGRELMEQGFSIKGERGTFKKHPSFTIFKTCAEVFIKTGELFGLSPRSRELLSVEISSKPDPFELLLDRYSGGKT